MQLGIHKQEIWWVFGKICAAVSSGTDLYDDVVDVTSFSALDVSS
jgi:hypothetical protein